MIYILIGLLAYELKMNLIFWVIFGIIVFYKVARGFWNASTFYHQREEDNKND